MKIYRSIILLVGAVLPALSGWAQDYPYGFNEETRRNFDKFLQAPNHKAFAVGPNSAFGWRSGRPSVEEAIGEALSTCRQYSSGDCQLVQMDDQRVAPPSYQAPPAYAPPPPPTPPQYESSTPRLNHLQREALEDGCRIRYANGNPHKYKECLDLGANWKDALAQGCQARYSENRYKLKECMDY